VKKYLELRYRMLPPARRTIDVRVAGEKATRAVVFTGRPVGVSV
jgi:hypothetical protein